MINNYFGRQFNSLNDLVVHPNGDLYFTDTLYGFLQDFRPPPGLRNQVYRYNFKTGAITVVADDFTLPNGELQYFLLSPVIHVNVTYISKVLPFLLTVIAPM